jgi:hypothetical protein
MSNAKAKWQEVGDRLTSLGLKLQLHLDQAAADGEPADEDGVRQALRDLGEAIEGAFTGLGNATRDEAVREDAKDVGRSLVDAVDATFSALAERLR